MNVVIILNFNQTRWACETLMPLRDHRQVKIFKFLILSKILVQVSKYNSIYFPNFSQSHQAQGQVKISKSLILTPSNSKEAYDVIEIWATLTPYTGKSAEMQLQRDSFQRAGDQSWTRHLNRRLKINRVYAVITNFLDSTFECDRAKTIVFIKLSMFHRQSAQGDLDLWPGDITEKTATSLPIKIFPAAVIIKNYWLVVVGRFIEIIN